MSMLAAFAVNKGVSYLGGKAFDMFAGSETGSSIISSAKNYLPSWLGGNTFTTNPAAYSGFAPTATNYGAFGEAPGTLVDGASAVTSTTSFLDGFNFMDVLPYTGAIIKLLQGDVAGAAATAAGVYIGTALFGPIGGAIGGFIFGSLFGDDDPYIPVPTVWRIVRVSGNNNLNAIVDLQAPKDNPPKEYSDLCDALLKVGFNATKTAELAIGKLAPYDFLMCSMNNRDGVFFSMRKGNPESADIYAVKVGASDKTFSTGKAASEIVKLITTAFKEAYAADAIALDNASKLLNKKTYKELSTGLTKELQKGTGKTGTNKLDASIERGVFGGTLAEDAIIMAGRTNAPQAATSSDSEWGSSSSPPMVYSMKEGKYVEAPSEMIEVDVVDSDYGYATKVKRKVYTPDVLMLDKNGNPIFDKNKSGGIDIADISVTPILSTTLSTFLAAANPLLSQLSPYSRTTETTTPVTVVTNADNSQRNNQSVNTYYASTLSKTKNPIKDAMLQTAMPA
jgi:hypothetical protein